MFVTGCPVKHITNPDGDQTVTIRISSGTVLGKSNFGMWKATEAKASCRWTVKIDGKLVASGGPDDAVISGHGIQGGVLSATNCGYFYK